MRSLERQLPLAASLLLSFVAALVTLAAYRNVGETARALYEERLLRLGGQLASAMGPGLMQSRANLMRAATSPAVIRALSEGAPDEEGAAVRVLDAALPGVQNLVVVGAWTVEGELVARSTDPVPDWLLVPPTPVDSATVSPVAVAADTMIHFGIVAPVRSGDRLVGFVQSRQRLGGSTGRPGVTAFFDESAILLLGSPGGVWTDFQGEAVPPPSGVARTGGLVEYERDGTDRVGYVETLGGTDLSLVAEIEESVILAPTRAFLRRVGGVALATLLAAVGAAWLLAHRITAPLAKLREAARHVGEGDYGSRAPEEGHSEIVQLAQTFNKMADETEGHVRALRHSEQRFRSLVTATSQIVLWTDADGNIREPVPSWQSYTGLSAEESRSAGWTAALHPDDAALAEGTWQEAIRQRSLYEAEYRIRRHDGVYRWFIVRFVPVLRRDGAIREWVGTGTDNTEQRETSEKLKAKELELQRAQRLEAVGRLAGGVAHDFNNLLTTILAPAELAQRALPDDHPIQTDLADIRDAAKRAGALTRKLLAFGRQQVLSTTLLDVNEAVESTMRLLTRVIGESISVDFIPAATRSTVVADPVQFEQIVVNLAVNARDAMPHGGQLTIETSDAIVDDALAEEHTGLEPGEYVVLAVTDTGVGMDRDVQVRIFEPFFTTKGDEQGTGLGLSTVYGIVRQSGGHILVYSEPGLGAAFRVLLPCADETAADVAARRSVPVREEPPVGSETILLAEDEEAIRRLAKRILSDLGYKVLAAEGGAQALALAADSRNAIDILVSDVVMPEMTGVELWERLREYRPGLPVLFLSGWASQAVVRHGILDGQVPFLQKPFSAFELGWRVRGVLDEQADG